ncbi:MAG: response regulator [Proteobacteria bacterium]|nr:response regulator [Pseudomonadota bacterium]
MRAKLVLLQATIAFVVLTLLTGLALYQQLENANVRVDRQLETSAHLVGANSLSALEFLDPDAATAVLGTLSTEPLVELAELRDASGQIFAIYRVEGVPDEPLDREAPPGVLHHSDGRAQFVYPVVQDGESMGVLILRASPKPRQEATRDAMVGFVLMLIVGLTLAIGLALLLESTISGPVLRLINAVKHVQTSEVLGERVTVDRDDELGVLSREFNQMLEIIAARTKETKRARDDLEQHKDDLEQTVADRTAELRDAIVAAEAASEAKTRFLATMSHEIRTPMNGALGMIYLALRTDLTARQRRYLEQAQSSAKALLILIDEVLDVSKIEAGRVVLEDVDFDVEEVLRELGVLYGTRAGDKGLELLFHTVSMPMRFRGDPVRLRQVLANLVDNALKFTESGEIIVGVALLQSADDRYRVQFSVEDTGIGLTEEQASRLFSPFVQADDSTTRRYGGSGLGLSICRGLVELMDGSIDVRSKPGVGSTFRFDISLAAPGELQPHGVMLDGMRVLVVDDNEVAREVMSGMLSSFGVDAVVVSSGEAALDAVHDTPAGAGFDLVLMDWKMPGMDGVEATAAIRADNRLDSLPVVLVTAHADALLAARHPVVRHVLEKPVSPSRLHDALMDVSASRIPEAAAPGPLGANLAGARILVAEDNQTNQLLISQLLEDADAEITMVNDGQAAVDAFTGERAEFDVVWMDIQMPRMDGREATRQLRKRFSKNVLPIMALTAHASSDEHRMCIEAGMDDVITKPLDPDRLVDVTVRLLTAIGRLEPGVAPVAGPAPIAPRVEDLPADLGLTHIDVADGLRRLRGNHALYRKILLGFGREQMDLEAKVRADVAAENYLAARDRVHAVRGAAGNIGALELYRASSDLETALRGGSAGPELERFYASLAPVLDELAALAPLPEAPAGPPVDAGELTERLCELRRMLEVGDTKALKHMDGLWGQLAELSDGDHVAVLRECVDAFAFDEALVALAAVEEAAS